MYHLSPQEKQPIGVLYVETSNSYDRMNHIIMALVWLSLLGDFSVIYVILLCIQITKYYQMSDFYRL